MDLRTFSLETKGGLYAYVRKSMIDSALCIINLHGYKSSIEEYIRSSMDMEFDARQIYNPFLCPTWVFPEAPFVFDEPDDYRLRQCSWFKMKGSRDLITGKWKYTLPADTSEINHCFSLIDDFIETLDYPRNQIIFAGHNQGAILALEYATTHMKDPFMGVAILMGAVIDKTSLPTINCPFKFLCVHSPNDEYFPIEPMEDRVDSLIAQGCDGSFIKVKEPHFYLEECQYALFDFAYDCVGRKKPASTSEEPQFDSRGKKIITTEAPEAFYINRPKLR